MASISVYLYLGNDTTIDVVGLINAKTSVYQNSATVTAVVKDGAGTEIISSQTLVYETGSDGNYSVTVDKSAGTLSAEVRYFVEITAAQGGLDGFWRIPVQAKYRES